MSRNTTRKITLRDSTLREGLDTPRVAFTPEQKLRIARLLDEAAVPEIEVVAPSRVLKDLEFASTIKMQVPRLRTSGLIYAYSPQAREEILAASGRLDHIDLMVPASERRPPFSRAEKLALVSEIVEFAVSRHSDVGVGFPHSTQTDAQFLLEISRRAVEAGATRLIIYDTNGSADPFSVQDLISRLAGEIAVPFLFHGHNDLGFAAANSLAAVRAGAAGLDVTVNGLGDRAGNACLEQVALTLHLRGFETGVALRKLTALSATVEKESGVPLSKLAPVVGEFVVRHKSPSHLADPDLFEAFDPELLGIERSLEP